MHGGGIITLPPPHRPPVKPEPIVLEPDSESPVLRPLTTLDEVHPSTTADSISCCGSGFPISVPKPLPLCDANCPMTGTRSRQANTKHLVADTAKRLETNTSQVMLAPRHLPTVRFHLCLLTVYAAAGAGRPRIRSATFSAIIIVGALVLPLGRTGMTELSTTRNPSIPCSCISGLTTASSS